MNKKKKKEENTILKVASTNYFAACNVYVMSAHMFVNRTILPGRIIIRVKLQYNKYASACTHMYIR